MTTTKTVPWYGYHTTTRAKIQSQRLAAIYFRAGAETSIKSYTTRASHVQMCSDIVATQAGKVVVQWRCKERLCPICAIAESRKIAANARLVLQRALTSGRSAYMLTLTQLNCGAEALPHRIDDMLCAWRAITHDLRAERRYIAGYARTIEITKSQRGEYHPHIHAILICEADTPVRMLRASYWADRWRTYMGTDAYQSVRPVCDIRRIRPNRRKKLTSEAAAAAEVAKYVAKASAILSRSDAYETVLTIDGAIRGRRLRTYGGVWRAIRQQLKLEDSIGDIEPPTTLLADVPVEIWQWSGADVGYQRIT